MDNKQGVSIEVYHSFDGLDHVRLDWDKLVEETTSSVFQTYDWCRIWWKYYGVNRRLFVLLFRQNDQLVGVMPLFSEKIWLGPVSINVIKRLVCDYTYSTSWPAICEPYFKEIFRLILDKMTSWLQWDIFLLDSMPGVFSSQVNRLNQSIREILPKGFLCTEQKEKEQIYFILKGGYDSYFQSLDKKRQHELRRKTRIFDEVAGSPDMLNSRIIPPEETEIAFDAFYSAHQKHWQQQNRSGHFGDWPKSREFHSELAQTMANLGRLRLLETRCGSEVIGYKYAYRCGKTLVEFLDARIDGSQFERASLGNLIFLEQVKRACQEGVELIDSLAGRYEHKLKMGGKLLPSRNLLIYRKKSWFRLKLFRNLTTILDFIYYKVWFCRICPRFNIRRGHLPKLWIRAHIFAD